MVRIPNFFAKNFLGRSPDQRPFLSQTFTGLSDKTKPDDMLH